MMKKCGAEPLVVCVGIVHVDRNMWHRRVTSAVAAADGRQPDKKLEQCGWKTARQEMRMKDSTKEKRRRNHSA
jgi:hypothetical protein